MFTIVGSHNLNHAKLHLLRLQIKSESGEQEINNIGRCLICVVPLIKIWQPPNEMRSKFQAKQGRGNFFFWKSMKGTSVPWCDSPNVYAAICTRKTNRKEKIKEQGKGKGGVFWAIKGGFLKVEVCG